MAVRVEQKAAQPADTRSEMKPFTGLRATFHGEAPAAPHKFHKNGFSVEGASRLFVPLKDVKVDTQPLRDPQALATREELITATTGLLRSFERVFDETYTGGRSNKSVIGMAVEVTVDHGPEQGGKAEWTVHHSPVEGGEYVHLVRKTVAYNGFDEVAQVTFLKPDNPNGSLNPMITFASHLQEREPNADGIHAKFDFVTPGQNTNVSWDGAVQLLHDFAEIADAPRDKVTFNTVASRSPVISQDEVRKETKKQMKALVSAADRKTPAERPPSRVNEPKDRFTTRDVLVTEAKAAGEIVDEVDLAEAYVAAYAQRENIALNGGTLFEPKTPRKEKPLTEFANAGEAALVEQLGKEYVTKLNLVAVDNIVNTGQDNTKIPAPTINELIAIDENVKETEASVRVYDSSAVAGPFGYGTAVAEPSFEFVETRGEEKITSPVSSDSVRMVIQTEVNKKLATYAVIGDEIVRAQRDRLTGTISLTKVDAEAAFKVSRLANKASEQFLQKENAAAQ